MPKYKIMQNDIGWIICIRSITDADDGWYNPGWGPFDRQEDAHAALLDHLARVADAQMKAAKREKEAKFYDEQGVPYKAAFAGGGAMGCTYGAGGCE